VRLKFAPYDFFWQGPIWFSGFNSWEFIKFYQKRVVFRVKIPEINDNPKNRA
jgi:hypothetical protein